MKHLLLLSLLTASLSGFGQVVDTTTELRQFNWSGPQPTSLLLHQNADGSFEFRDQGSKPDTLRAICLVTLFPNGIAHARMGFVVIEQGKSVVYLDCRKRALRLPQVGWGYVEVNPNRK